MRFPFAIVCLVLLLAPAARADGPQSAEAAMKAARELIAHTEGLAKAGKRPDYSAPPASDYMRRIFDTQAFAALPPPQGSDVPWLVNWGDAANSTNKILMLFGTGPGVDQNAAIGRNMTDNEDAMVTAWSFMLRLNSRMSVAMSQFFKELPPEQRTAVRIEGASQARTGYVEMITGTLITIAAGLKPANERILISALRDTAPGWVITTKPEERARLLYVIGEARKAKKDGNVEEGLKVLASMIAAGK